MGARNTLGGHKAQSRNQGVVESGHLQGAASGSSCVTSRQGCNGRISSITGKIASTNCTKPREAAVLRLARTLMRKSPVER